MPCLPLGPVSISTLDESPSLYLIKSSFPTYLKYIQQPHVKVALLSFHLFFHEPFHFSSFVIVTTVCSKSANLSIRLQIRPFFAKSVNLSYKVCTFSLRIFIVRNEEGFQSSLLSKRAQHISIQICDEQGSVLFIAINTNTW